MMRMNVAGLKVKKRVLLTPQPIVVLVLLTACAMGAEPKEQDNAAKWTELMKNGNALFAKGEYKKAEEMYRAASSLAEDIFDVHDPRTGSSYLNLGNLYCDLGRYKEAEALQLNALTIWQLASKEDGSLVALACVNLGETLRLKGDLQGAKRHLEFAQEFYSQPNGKSDSNSSICKLNLGMVYRDLGKLNDAEGNIDGAIALDVEQWGKDSEQVASDLRAKALIKVARSEQDAGIKLLRDAVKIQQQTLGNEHPELAVSLQNLASLEYKAGEIDSARTHYKASYLILYKKFEHDTPVFLAVAREYLEILKAIEKKEPDESKIMDEIKSILVPTQSAPAVPTQGLTTKNRGEDDEEKSQENEQMKHP